MMPASIPDLHPRSRAKILPLPITCLAVPSIYEEPQGIYLQRPSSPPQAMSPAPPTPHPSKWKLLSIKEQMLWDQTQLSMNLSSSKLIGWTHNEPYSF